MLAGYLQRVYGHDAQCVSRTSLDISDSATFRAILETGEYGVVINTAGASGGSREGLFDVNAFYPSGLARVCGEFDIVFVFLSSGRVFDGTKNGPYVETDSPNPLDDYGLSKFTGEKMVENELFCKKYYTFRLPQVLGLRRRNMSAQGVHKLIEQMARGEKVLAADDLFNTPAYAGDIAHMIRNSIESGLRHGIYHLTTAGRASLYELVGFISGRLGYNANIHPVHHAHFRIPGRRPHNTMLSSEKIPLGCNWRESISGFIEEMKDAALEPAPLSP